MRCIALGQYCQYECDHNTNGFITLFANICFQRQKKVEQKQADLAGNWFGSAAMAFSLSAHSNATHVMEFMPSFILI